MSQFQLEIFEEPGKDFEVDGSCRELMSLSCIQSSNVQLILSFDTLLISLKKKTNYQRHNFVRIQYL
jgi:hypothetical protein